MVVLAHHQHLGMALYTLQSRLQLCSFCAPGAQHHALAFAQRGCPPSPPGPSGSAPISFALIQHQRLYQARPAWHFQIEVHQRRLCRWTFGHASHTDVAVQNKRKPKFLRTRG